MNIFGLKLVKKSTWENVVKSKDGYMKWFFKKNDEVDCLNRKLEESNNKIKELLEQRLGETRNLSNDFKVSIVDEYIDRKSIIIELNPVYQRISLSFFDLPRIEEICDYIAHNMTKHLEQDINKQLYYQLITKCRER